MPNSMKLTMDFVFLSLCCPFFFPPTLLPILPFFVPSHVHSSAVFSASDGYRSDMSQLRGL